MHAFKESVHGGVAGKGLGDDHIAAGALLLQPRGEIDGHAKIVQPSVQINRDRPAGMATELNDEFLFFLRRVESGDVALYRKHGAHRIRGFAERRHHRWS